MLTAIQVRNARPKDKAYKVTDGKGLFLHITPAGDKTWRYRYELAGIESTYVIGKYPDITLEAARNERAALREKVKKGINPAIERRQVRREEVQSREAEKAILENCFEAVANDWHFHQKDRWAKAHAEAILTSFKKDVFPSLGAVQVDKITPPMVFGCCSTD